MNIGGCRNPFIEVTNNNRKLLVNVNTISLIDVDNNKTVIWFRNDYTYCEESYDEVKEMITNICF